MKFCVSPKPHLDIHGRSPEAIASLFRELAEMGVGGIDLERAGQTEGLEWPAFAATVRDAAREFGFGVSLHPGGWKFRYSPDMISAGVPTAEHCIHSSARPGNPVVS